MAYKESTSSFEYRLTKLCRQAYCLGTVHTKQNLFQLLYRMYTIDEFKFMPSILHIITEQKRSLV